MKRSTSFSDRLEILFQFGMFRVKLSLEKHVQQNIITTCFVLFVFVRGELVSNGVLIVSLLDALGFNSILNVMIASK